MSTKETKFVAFRATEELSAAARKRAKEQHRSLSGYLNNLIEQDLGSSILSAKAKEEIAETARHSSHITNTKKTRRE